MSDYVFDGGNDGCDPVMILGWFCSLFLLSTREPRRSGRCLIVLRYLRITVS